MAVIRDVMPMFELFQPASIDDALALLERHGADAWVLAGGMDTFDWLKDRSKRVAVVVDLSQIGALRGIKEVDGGLEIGALTTLTEVTQHAGDPGEVRDSERGGRAGGVAADPEPGDARRQRVAGHALLVLPQRVDLLPGRRQHLLRRHADGDQPGACDSGGGPVRGGESVGHGAGADRAGRVDGDAPRGRRASGWCRRKSISSGRGRTSRG